MVSKLTKAMSELSQNDDDETHPQRQQNQSHQQQQQQQQPPPNQGRRKSARLNIRRGEAEEQIHDSGTESDEEEMECIAKFHDPRAPWQNYDEFLSGASPPPLTASPPLPADGDTESWYSFGHESGIMTGDNDSDDGSATPTPNRRQMMKELAAVRNEDDTSSIGGEKRRYSMTTNDHPIAWRLRSFNLEAPRPVKVAARRCPVHVLINRPPTETMCQFRHVLQPQQQELQQQQEPEILPAPAPKRNRRNSHRPSLDFEKMVETRIQSPSPPPSAPTVQKPVTRSQINQ